MAASRRALRCRLAPPAGSVPSGRRAFASSATTRPTSSRPASSGISPTSRRSTTANAARASVRGERRARVGVMLQPRRPHLARPLFEALDQPARLLRSRESASARRTSAAISASGWPDPRSARQPILGGAQLASVARTQPPASSSSARSSASVTPRPRRPRRRRVTSARSSCWGRLLTGTVSTDRSRSGAASRWYGGCACSGAPARRLPCSSSPDSPTR